MTSERRISRRDREPLPAAVRLAAPAVLGAVLLAAVAMAFSSGGGDASHAAGAPTTHPVHRYVVRDGDSLSSVAAKYHTSVSVLQDLNHGIDPTDLEVGTRLRVPR